MTCGENSGIAGEALRRLVSAHGPLRAKTRFRVPLTLFGKEDMRYRSLWIIALTVESVLMIIGVVTEKSASMSLGILLGLTQMPSLAFSNWMLSDHVGSMVPFYVLTWVLQSAFFGSILCAIKWAKDALQKKE